MADFDFDLLTLGAGSGGVAASRRAASYGARVAICEGRRIGGTCVLRGCVPKKILMYASAYAAAYQDATHFGWSFESAPRFSWPELIARKNAELDRLHGIYGKMLQNAGVQVFEGYGRFVDPHTVQVGDQEIRARSILIATGGLPHRPAGIEGHEHCITSDEALDLPEKPQKIAIIGAGFIGVEFAGIFNALGSEVHLLYRADHILRGFDQAISEHLEAQMQLAGVQLHSQSRPQRITKDDAGPLRVELENGKVFEGLDQVLLATGRHPHTDKLDLPKAGLSVAPGQAIAVDEWSRTAVEHIYAVGDVVGKIDLTPVAIADGRALAETLFNNNPVPSDHELVPSAVFSQPPVATVGATEQELKDQDIDYRVYQTSFRPLRFAMSGATGKTMMKVLVDRQSERVLGCHMVGDDAPEIVQGLAVALKAGATKKQFDATVGIHPTAAEEFVTMYQEHRPSSA